MTNCQYHTSKSLSLIDSVSNSHWQIIKRSNTFILLNKLKLYIVSDQEPESDCRRRLLPVLFTQYFIFR